MLTKTEICTCVTRVDECPMMSPFTVTRRVFLPRGDSCHRLDMVLFTSLTLFCFLTPYSNSSHFRSRSRSLSPSP
ncbi:unnamed protein product [Chondrus crispus]|uniref:Uncharacterized protein n=1 Tax=Chondrus crispus TaxID=2769 RepID=R7QIB5_CHOCR|nr:unnamed protein product [Chondrus crispus]CDF37221.1 unnamed protein product [Chondrus crispus]|eukprot:XP_005717040.1 unnamed protein product [Chondrus crispus]